MPTIDESAQVRATQRKNMLIWCRESITRLLTEVEREFGSEAALPLVVALQGICDLRNTLMEQEAKCRVNE